MRRPQWSHSKIFSLLIATVDSIHFSKRRYSVFILQALGQSWSDSNSSQLAMALHKAFVCRYGGLVRCPEDATAARIFGTEQSPHTRASRQCLGMLKMYSTAGGFGMGQILRHRIAHPFQHHHVCAQAEHLPRRRLGVHHMRQRLQHLRRPAMADQRC